MKHAETLYCELYNYTCQISRNLAQFLLNSSILYCSSLSKVLKPYIHPIIYIYHMNSCILTFAIPKVSEIAKNFLTNPFITLTNDIINKNDPSFNNGIMIQAIASFDRKQEKIEQLFHTLKKRYSSFDVPELVDSYLKKPEILHNKYILVNANILKIIYWEGPIIHKQETLICPARKYLFNQQNLSVEMEI